MGNVFQSTGGNLWWPVGLERQFLDFGRVGYCVSIL
jgi:hypothetical protein